MAAFGVSAKPYENMSSPGIEVVDIFGDSGDYYTARTLGTVNAVQVTPRSTGVTAQPSYEISGRQVTLTVTGVTNTRFTMTLYGY